MNKYTIISPGVTWTCKANSEEEAWESLAQLKRLPVKELKKLFKCLNEDDPKKDNNQTK